jgi:uncharacterized membrane protein YfcA
VVTQNVGAVWAFHRHRVLDWRWAIVASAPALLGSALGAWLALRIGDQGFRRVLATLMLAVTLWTLLDHGGRLARGLGRLGSRPTVLLVGFFLVGMYTGFVQAGVGFFVLALTTLAGLDLVHGNAVKVLVILLTTALALLIFAWEGTVNWTAGFVLAAGSLAGSLVGVRLTVVRSQVWLRGVVLTALVVFALRLWFW